MLFPKGRFMMKRDPGRANGRFPLTRQRVKVPRALHFVAFFEHRSFTEGVGEEVSCKSSRCKPVALKAVPGSVYFKIVISRSEYYLQSSVHRLFDSVDRGSSGYIPTVCCDIPVPDVERCGAVCRD